MLRGVCMTKNRYRVCRLDELPEQSCRAFAVETATHSIEGFVVRIEGERIYAYENRCPHTGVPLNWQPDQFFDPENRFIQCSMHGALFEIGSGRCVYGPCVDQNLSALKLSVAEGVIWCEYGVILP